MNDRNEESDGGQSRSSPASDPPETRSGDSPDRSGDPPESGPGDPPDRSGDPPETRSGDSPDRSGDSPDRSDSDGAGSGSSGAAAPVSAAGDTPGGSSDGAAAAGRSVAEKAGIDAAVVGNSRNLDPNVRYRWMVGSSVGAVVIGVVVAVGAFAFGATLPGMARGVRSAAAVGAVVFAVLFLVGAVRAVLLYRSWEYVVREDSLFLSRGVLTRVRTVAPYVRVQHVDTRRSPVERLLGLSTLVVYTAGSRGADVTIPGLTPDRATDLQERLKRLAIESEEEDAV